MRAGALAALFCAATITACAPPRGAWTSVGPSPVAETASEASPAAPADPELVCRGVVTDEAGVPIPGAEVRLSRQSGFSSSYWTEREPPSIATTRTGSDGAWAIPLPRWARLGRVRWLFTIAREGRGTEREIHVDPSEAHSMALTTKLGPELVAAGRVTDARDVPLAGCEVRVFGRFGNVVEGAATTDADGRYRIAALNADHHVVSISKPGFPVVRYEAHDPADLDGDHVTVLPDARRISGRVVGRTSRQPVAGRQVRAWPKRAKEPVAQLAVTAPDGTFTLDLLPGAHTVTVEGDHHALEIAEAATTVELVVDERMTLRFRAVDAETGRDVVPCAAELGIAGEEPPADSGPSRRRVFDTAPADGIHEIRGLSHESRYTLTVIAEGYGRTEVPVPPVLDHATPVVVTLASRRRTVLP